MGDEGSKLSVLKENGISSHYFGKRRRDNRPVNAEANMEDLLDKVMNQNFVPVIDDDHVFIGLITRKDVISYLANKSKAD